MEGRLHEVHACALQAGKARNCLDILNCSFSLVLSCRLKRMVLKFVFQAQS